jgi:hypothetical protein
MKLIVVELSALVVVFCLFKCAFTANNFSTEEKEAISGDEALLKYLHSSLIHTEKTLHDPQGW